MVFFIYREILLSANWACEVGAMTEGNIPGTNRKKLLLNLLSVYIKTHRRETKLFKFSRDTNGEELKIRKKTTSLCNSFVAMVLLQWPLLLPFAYVTSRVTIFVDEGLHRKILARFQGFLRQWKFIISCTKFFITVTGQ